MLGWVGNILIVAGMGLVAYKRRSGFVLGIVGNSLWCVRGVQTNQMDLVSIELVVVIVQLFSWWKWGRDVKKKEA